MTDPYDSTIAVRWSLLKELRRSPRHLRHRLAEERTDTIHMRLGRLVHSLILEPDTVDRLYAVYDGPVRRGKKYDEFAADNAGAEIILANEMRDAENMANAVLDDPAAAPVLEGVKERPVYWVDEPTGLPCKAKPDSVNGRLVELKSANANDYGPDRFWRHARRLGYHGQLAHYGAGLEAHGFERDDTNAIVVVESKEPYDVVVYRVPDAMTAEGRLLWRSLLDQLAHCVEHNHWPGASYGQEIELFWPEPITQGATLGGVPL